MSANRLEDKMWWRFIKVIYFGAYLFVIGFSWLLISAPLWELFFWFAGISILVIEIVRSAFLYVVGIKGTRGVLRTILGYFGI